MPLDVTGALAAVGVSAIAYFVFVLFFRGPGSTKIQLHKYQVNFLNNFTVINSLGDGPAPALDAIVKLAAQDKTVYEEMYGDFICIHCGSVNPADWINNFKGEKLPYDMKLDSASVKLLSSAPLKKVEKLGEPPKKQVVDGPTRTDIHKAARVAVDWAIQKFNALSDGMPVPMDKKGQ